MTSSFRTTTTCVLFNLFLGVDVSLIWRSYFSVSDKLMQNSMIRGPFISESTVSFPMQCATKCLEREECRSFNIVLDTLRCQLSNTSAECKRTAGEKVVYQKGANVRHYTKKDNGPIPLHFKMKTSKRFNIRNDRYKFGGIGISDSGILVLGDKSYNRIHLFKRHRAKSRKYPGTHYYRYKFLKIIGEEDLKYVSFLEADTLGDYVMVCNKKPKQNCAYLFDETGYNFGCIGVPLQTHGALMNSRGTDKWRVFLVYDGAADNYILEKHTVQWKREGKDLPLLPVFYHSNVLNQYIPFNSKDIPHWDTSDSHVVLLSTDGKMYILPLYQPSQTAKSFDLSKLYPLWSSHQPKSVQWHPGNDRIFVSSSTTDPKSGRRKIFKLFDVGVNVKCAGKWKVNYVKEKRVMCYYSFQRGAGKKKGHISRFSLDTKRAMGEPVGLVGLCRSNQGYILQRLFSFRLLSVGAKI